MPNFTYIFLSIIITLFLQSHSAIVRTGAITKIPHIPYDFSYSIFSSKYKLQLILLCEETTKKSCNEYQDLLNHIQKIYDSSHIGVAVIEAKNIKEIQREKLIYEGFPSIYYISLYSYERELLSFNINQDTLNRFIKSKLDPFKKHIASEDTLIQSLMTNSASRALVVIGNEAISEESFYHCARIGEMRLVYQMTNEQYSNKVMKEKEEGLVVYYKNKTNGEYEYRAIELEKDSDKSALSNRVLFAFKEGNNRDLNQLTVFDMELALEKNVLSIIYIYNTLSDIEYIKDKVNDFIQRYEDKISFSKASLNDDLLKKLNLKQLLNINDTMLPGFFCLIPFINYDDVIKYYIPFNQGKNITERLEEAIENKPYKSINRVVYAENNDTLNNIKSHIENKREFILLICSNKLLKYRRVTQRIKRALVHIRNQVIYEEIDPLVNEIDFMTYDYIPTIAYIKYSNTTVSSDIVINRLEADFTSEAILNFIKTHSSTPIDSSIQITPSIIHSDNEHPLYPVHKSRYEKKLLSKGTTISNQVGLKRQWWSLKAQRKITKGNNDQKYLSDYLGYSDVDYEKKDYISNKKTVPQYQPKTDL